MGKLSINDFETKSKENDGLKFFVTMPDGTPTETYLVLYGLMSDIMTAAHAKYEKSKGTDAEKDAAIDFIATAIKDWNLEEPCTMENKRKLVGGSTTIRSFINRKLTNDRDFFGTGLNPYSKKTDTPNASSGSGSETSEA